jgi:hypothetical protein
MAVKTHKPAAKTQPVRTPGKDFLLAVLDMSWRLAIVVLLPIIGGYKLDQFLGTLPALTIIGFVVAMSGMAYVMWRAIKEYS